MNLHEYQAKQLFSAYHLPVLKGVVAHSVEEALSLVDTLTTTEWVVKAQVHAGGRGKAGGVKQVRDKAALKEVVQALLHSKLVTPQTAQEGLPVNAVWIEESCEIKRELYLSVLIDRSVKKVVIIASEKGGMDIEKIAKEAPEYILKFEIDPLLGVLPFQGRALGIKLHLNDSQIKQLTFMLQRLYQLFLEQDLSLVEINPLVIDEQERLFCLDAKITVDDNALYRQKKLLEMRDLTQENEKEKRASEWGLNYIALQGDIGCMVNGAGLAMATLDIIQLKGGSPANFLDVGGGTTEERVKEAFKIILSDAQVKVVLVNIVGGIVRCDLIASGILRAIEDVGIQVPVVVRLQGNSAKEGIHILQQSHFNITTALLLDEAVEAAVSISKGR